MPNIDGKMFFSDYKSELRLRGFDGFSDSDLGILVNRGYFHVARRSQWYWSEATDYFTIDVGQTFAALWPQIGGELPNFRSLDKLYGTTTNMERQLFPLTKKEFFDRWLSQDLTKAAIRGEPTGYYIWQKALYVLPPPKALRTFLGHYHQRVSFMSAPGDQPITPIHLDEAILEASLIRCHQRANEPTLAQYAEAALEEFFDDMRDDEQNLMEDQPDRVTPDNTWL
jgi:hypothetical protein